MFLRVTLPVGLIVVAFLTGCRQEQHPVVTADAAPTHTVSKDSKIIVPAGVQERWKAVKVAVFDKPAAVQKIYSIPVGGRLAVPSSDLVIEVEAFLPAFTMEGPVITSSSLELKNPGAKVRILENGKMIFRGWLFSLFPKTHAFMHPRFGFTLVDVVPARK